MIKIDFSDIKDPNEWREVIGVTTDVLTNMKNDSNAGYIDRAIDVAIDSLSRVLKIDGGAERIKELTLSSDYINSVLEEQQLKYLNSTAWGTTSSTEEVAESIIGGLKEPIKGDNKKEMVIHPAHYNNEKYGIEVLDVIEAFTDGLNGVEAFCAGNAIKYSCRWHNKNGIEDLKKAANYINILIAKLENK